MIRLATSTIYGENMLARHVPGAESFMAMMDERPHVRRKWQNAQWLTASSLS